MSNIVIIAKPARLRLLKYLDENKIEYKYIKAEDLPDGVPGGCRFRGVTFVGSGEVFGLESKLNREEVYNILYKIVPGAENHRKDDEAYTAARMDNK